MYITHSMEIGRMAWHSPKIISLKMDSNNMIEGGECENRSPEARLHVFYAIVNLVLEKFKLHANSNSSNDRIRMGNVASKIPKQIGWRMMPHYQNASASTSPLPFLLRPSNRLPIPEQ